MAKTDFAFGTVVSPEFLDSIFHTSGGHKHDGADDDGHAGKINLAGAAEVTGALPWANIANYYEQDVSCQLRGSDFSGGTPVSVTFRVTRIGRMVVLAVVANALAPSNSTTLVIEPDVGGGETWPSFMLPSAERYARCAGIVTGGVHAPGTLVIPSSGSTIIEARLDYLALADDIVYLSPNVFKSTGNKGVVANLTAVYHL